MEKIIVVDMVNGFCKEGALHDERILEIVPKIKALVELKKDSKVIVLEDSHLVDAKEFSSFPLHCLKGTSEAKTIDELSYLFNLNNFEAVIEKNSTNGFYKLNEAKLLDASTYYLVGCCTDICVLQLALSLVTYINENNLNQKVVVVKDAVSTFDIEGHEANKMSELALNLMASSGVIVKELADLC